jgi:superfamily II DNA or RNA helicase
VSNRSAEGRGRSYEDLEREIDLLQAENARLRELLGARTAKTEAPAPAPAPIPPASEATLFGDGDVEPVAQVDARSSAAAKIELFRGLFCGRDDVYATRWDSPRKGKSGWSPAVVGGPANARKPDRAYLRLTDEVIEAHLSGRVHVGLYPLLPGDSCRLLACDFDGSTWPLDARAYQDAARALGFDAALERSRSGNGAHVWIFFAGPVAASVARRIGAYLLREAMTVRAELDLASYDRLFPAQDFMPKGSFGNLIALPLQGASRKQGTTVFLDDSLRPHDDQFAFLSRLRRVSAKTMNATAQQLREVATGPVEPTYRRPFRAGAAKPPDRVLALAGAMLAIDRIGLPPALIAALKHLASLHNPEYYEKERLRLSTWNTPRLIRCYEETIDQLLLPRGLREAAASLAVEAGSRLDVRETAWAPRTIDVRLRAVLDADQQVAFEELGCHDLGVLVAPPGTGKTVVGCALVAQRATSTLVLVDRQPLAEQWRERLQEHLGLRRRQIGTLGGGAGRLRGLVDVAMVQSLARREDVRELTAGYGLVIVDECHHVPATTFERVVRQIGAPAWLGLTATPYRRDGLEGLITMYCGPVRHKMSGDSGNTAGGVRTLIVHSTDHRDPVAGTGETPPAIQAVFRGLVADDARTRQICGDVAAAVESGRNCLVLSQWKEHVGLIRDRLEALGIRPDVLVGGVGKKERRATVDRLASAQPGDGILLVATGSLLGEGFDCPPLDTLFVAFPIAFRGRIVQYVGRVLRPVEGKARVEVHDYVDHRIPVLARMHAKRLAAYATLGFDVGRAVLDNR